MNKHIFSPTILRAYDIRGIYQDTLTEEDGYAIGMAFIACLRDRELGVTVAVGRDGRLSSPTLAAALIDGLVKAGGRVLDESRSSCSAKRPQSKPNLTYSDLSYQVWVLSMTFPAFWGGAE